jgi:hypothetical protein
MIFNRFDLPMVMVIVRRSEGGEPMFISHVIAITQLPIFIAPGIGGLRANG